MKENTCVGLIAPFPPPLGGMAIQATKLVENLRMEGFDVIEIPTNLPLPGCLKPIEKMKFVRTLIRSPYLLYQIYRHCPRVDVFYFLTGFFHFFFWVTLPVLLLLKAKRNRVILSARGGDAGRFFKRWKPIVKCVLKIPQIVTVPSGFLQKEFSDLLQIRALIVPNIVDLHLFPFRERSFIQPQFITARHLEEIYNIACTIRAFKKISQAYPQSRLTIVGDGSQRESLQRLIHSLGLNGNVRLAGRVPHDQLPALYDLHDIFINSSNVDNLPGAILESFASGLPVVSTRAGGIPYLVQDQKTGLLVELEDCEALAEAAISLIVSPKTAQRIAQNAFEYVREYSWNNVRKILLPLLQQSCR